MIFYLRLGCLFALLLTICCKKPENAEHLQEIPAREDGAVELSLMSFNVRYETPDDAGLRAWRERVVGATRVIRQQKSDCIGVQEALHGQVADLWASLPDYDFFGVGREDGRRVGEYSGIFFRKDRFRFDPADGGTFWLSDTPERPGSMTWGNTIPRVVVWVRLVDLTTGRGFYVFNTHWDHKNQKSRELAALLIATRIDARRHASEPVALLGDFNSNEMNPGLMYLTGKRVRIAGSERIWANGLLDTYQTLHAGESNRRTLHFWTGNREGALKVDHILVSRSAEVMEAAIITADRPVVSDHFPVMARVKFPLGK